MHEALRALARRHVGGGKMIWHACSIVIAEELHIAAQWHGGDLPSCAVTVVEAEQFRAKADRKSQNLDAAEARNQEMAKFMEKNHHRQNEQKRYDVTQNASSQGAKA